MVSHFIRNGQRKIMVMEKTEAKVLFMNGSATTAKSAANGITLPSATNTSDPAGDFNNGRNKTIEKAGESSLKKLFCIMINDVYNSEMRLLDELPGLLEATTTLKLKNAFEQQLQQTASHIARLEKVFELIDKKIHGKKCAAMEGLISESKTMIRDTKEGTIIRDIALIVSAQKITHYEIATYANIIHLALISGLTKSAEVLDSILIEEESTDELFSRIAEILISVEAEERNGILYWSS